MRTFLCFTILNILACGLGCYASHACELRIKTINLDIELKSTTEKTAFAETH